MESKFLYLSLTLSIIGLLILIYTAETIEPPLSRIKDINQNSVGKNVHITGNITKIQRFKGKSILLSIDDDTGNINVYLPYGVAIKFSDSIKEGNRADIIGTVEIYKGDIEIFVENTYSLRIEK